LQRTLAHFKERPGAEGINDAETELQLLGADEDDIGQTHVRLNQMHNGIPVLGGQLIAHLDDQSMRDVSGRMLAEARIDTTPALTDEQAIAAAISALGFTGEFASEPKARLVVLPHQVFKHEDEQGATLVYQVGLRIIDEAWGRAHHQYFVDAKDASIVWHYDGMTSAYGKSLYSGTVYVNSETLARDKYRLRDIERGNSEVRDMNNKTTGNGIEFIDSDNTWGDGTVNNRQTVAVDAYHGFRMAWEYFRTQHGRLGLDGFGAGVNLHVHDINNPNNAGGDKYGLYFGDGDGSTRNPWVSVDVVGHEYTHAMIDYIIPDDSDADSEAGFIYAGESGAIEESFADIFGTEVERYSGSNFDYLIGEDIVAPFQAGGALRNMANPTDSTNGRNNPDHYSNRRFQGACTPNRDTNDWCGVHINSSIMNHAYYLLAEGGTHRLSGISVPKMGYSTARWIFYKALTTGMTNNARFMDMRRETMRVARDEFPDAPRVRKAVERAWDAVGVLDPARSLDSIALTGPAGWNMVWVAVYGSDGNFSVTSRPAGDFAIYASQGAVKLAGDFNGDGATDIALTGPSWWNTIPVLSSMGDGTFRSTNLAPLGERDFPLWASQGAKILTGDFNGDKRTDIALTGNPQWRSVPVAFSNGGGYFYATNARTDDFAIYASQGAKALTGDFNGDDRTDIALTGPSSWDTLPVAFSKGDGRFDVKNERIDNFATWASQALQAGGEAVVGDFNGDGADDIALIGPESWNTIPVAFSNWNGTFTVHNISAVESVFGWAFPLYASAARLNNGVVRVGDFNGDLKADIAIVGIPNFLPVALSNISPTSNRGFNIAIGNVGNFGDWSKQTCLSNGSVLTGDFNRDGRTDIALTGTPGWATIPVAFSFGNGTFDPQNLPAAEFAAWSSLPQVTRLAGRFR
jgi:Zn-dependent metalloprotease